MNGVQQLRVLVIDDSPLVRQVVKGILEKVPTVAVVQTAPNASLAMRAIEKHDPDVITLDIEMPGLDGIALLKKIMLRWPRPVIMLSSYTSEGASKTLRALEAGAVDFIQKPSGRLSRDLAAVEEELVEKVTAVGLAHLNRLSTVAAHPDSIPRSTVPARHISSVETPIQGPMKVLAVGASTGGTEAIRHLLRELPEDFPAGILVVQHMPEGFTRAFAERLNQQCAIEVKEAANKDLVRPGRVLIAPGHSHMCLNRAGDNLFVTLNKKPTVSGHRPSVDVLFQSVAQHAKADALGVLLTGMGRDGADGLLEILSSGGDTVAQDESSSVVFGMPKAAIDQGAAEHVSSLHRLPALIKRFL